MQAQAPVARRAALEQPRGQGPALARWAAADAVGEARREAPGPSPPVAQAGAEGCPWIEAPADRCREGRPGSGGAGLQRRWVFTSGRLLRPQPWRRLPGLPPCSAGLCSVGRWSSIPAPRRRGGPGHARDLTDALGCRPGRTAVGPGGLWTLPVPWALLRCARGGSSVRRPCRRGGPAQAPAASGAVAGGPVGRRLAAAWRRLLCGCGRALVVASGLTLPRELDGSPCLWPA